MKVAVLSDIHGNHLALAKALDQAEQYGVECLLVLGDIVGYYYHPDQVLKLLEQWPKVMVQGNHERLLETVFNDPQKAEAIRKKYGSGINIALDRLSADSIMTLIELPRTKIVKLAGLSFFLCHGSPWDEDQYIYPNSDNILLERCVVGGTDFVLMGHTHYPLTYEKNGIIIANPGSIGQSREKGGLANWALIDTDNRTISIKSTPYDVCTVVQEANVIDPDIPYLRRVLLRG